MPQQLKSKASFRHILFGGILPLLFASVSLVQGAQSVILSWNANTETNIAGYRVKYGTTAGSYTQSVDVGNKTTATISNLNAGTTYYFTATAYNTAGAESLPSDPPVAYTATGNGLNIDSIQMLSNGTVQINISGPAGQNITTSWSQDMATWTPLLNSVNTSGTTSVIDSSASAATRRFYRVTSGTTTSDAAGFTQLRVYAAAGATPTLSFLAIPMLSQVSYSGTVTAKATSTITDSAASWTSNQFNGANGDYFLEITSGSNAGLMTDILATNAATKSLTTDDDLSTLLKGGETYRIRKHRTIGDVFGATNSAGLATSNTVTNADEIRIFNPVTQAYQVFYYQTNGTGGTGWRASTDTATDASKTKLYMDQGVVVKRKAATGLKLNVTGLVKTGPTIVPIGAGTNSIANMYAAGTLTLANSGIYTGSSTTGIASANGASGADEVRIWDVSSSTFARYYYKSGAGWRLSGSSADAGATQLAAGTSFNVTREKGRVAYNWRIPQPF